MSLSHRRDILKFFGVGASIIPIIGGEPVRAAEAKLIEEPKIEPANFANWDAAVMKDLDDLTAYAHHRKVPMAVLHIDPVSGHRHFFTAYSLINKQGVFPPWSGLEAPHTHWNTTPDRLVRTPPQIHWQLKGTCLPTIDKEDREVLAYLYSFQV